MSGRPPPPGLTEADFDRIEEAVMETERGRWFLAEYARRIRAESAGEIVGALARIEDSLQQSRSEMALSGWTARLAALEERLQDLAWRLQEEKSERAHAVLVSEIAALRELAPPPAALPHVQGSSLAASEPAPDEASGRLSQRLQSIDRLGSGPGRTALREQRLGDFDAQGPLAPPEPAADRRLQAFSAIEAMSAAERFAFFA